MKLNTGQKQMKNEPNKVVLQKWFFELTDFQSNHFHPFVWIVGSVCVPSYSLVAENHATIKPGYYLNKKK